MAKVVKMTSHKNVDAMVLDNGKVFFIDAAKLGQYCSKNLLMGKIFNYLKADKEVLESFWVENQKMFMQVGDKVSEYNPGFCMVDGDCLAWNKEINSIKSFLDSNVAEEAAPQGSLLIRASHCGAIFDAAE